MKIEILFSIFILLCIYFIYYNCIGKYKDSNKNIIIKSFITIFLICFLLLFIIDKSII